ncbi:hypothetical protein [Psychrobacillus sp. L3]|uniref:hypothetical protein n=1 Tax=Psychrobacillus sp. L3 TaxID=3236891 RepID=UPI0036F2874F
MKKFICLLVAVLIFSMVSPSMIGSAQVVKVESQPQRTKMVESFESEYFSDTPDDIGVHEVAGYKKTNVVTDSLQDDNGIETNLLMAEDYYDLDGHFVKSLVSIQYAKNDINTGNSEVTIRNKELSNQSTILNKTSKSTFVELSDESKILIEKHLTELTKDKDSFSFEVHNFKGMTKEDIKTMKTLINEANEARNSKQYSAYKNVNYNTTWSNDELNVGTLATIERAGAYDNYYTHDTNSGAYTAQVLSYSSPHRYGTRSGNTVTTSKAATQMVDFKKHIMKYETTLEINMLSNKYTEVTDWCFAIASTIVFLAGYGTGPVGWVGSMIFAVNALSLLRTWTSFNYGSTERVELSKVAQEHLKNAQQVFNYGDWGTGFSVVVGF